VFNDQTLEIGARKKSEQLAEHANKIPLAGGLLRLLMFFHSPHFQPSQVTRSTPCAGMLNLEKVIVNRTLYATI